MYVACLNLSFKPLLSSFALFMFVVAQYELNILTDVSWYHTRKVEDELITNSTVRGNNLLKYQVHDELLTNSTEERNNLQQKDKAHDASSIILPLALAGLAVLLILMGCLGALFYFNKR